MIPMMKTSCISFLLLFAFQGTVSSPNILDGLLGALNPLLSGVLPSGGSSDPVSKLLPGGLLSDLLSNIVPSGGAPNLVSGILPGLVSPGGAPNLVSGVLPGIVPGGLPDAGGILSGIIPGIIPNLLLNIISNLLGSVPPSNIAPATPGVTPGVTPVSLSDLNITLVIKRPEGCCPSSCPECKTCTTCEVCTPCPGSVEECPKPDPNSPCKAPSNQTLAKECSAIGGVYCATLKLCFHSQRSQTFAEAKTRCSASNSSPFCHRIPKPEDIASPEALFCLKNFIDLIPDNVRYWEGSPENGKDGMCKVMNITVVNLSDITQITSTGTVDCTTKNKYFCIASLPEKK